jgi:hypothetical protein
MATLRAKIKEAVVTNGSGYRTLIFGAFVTVLGAVQGLDWVHIVNDPTVAGWIVTGIGLVVMALRYFTTTPITVPATAKTPEIAPVTKSPLV